MPPRIGIDSEEQIVLVGLEFDDAVEVGGLEGATECYLVGEVEGWVHSLEGAIVNSRLVEVVVLQLLLDDGARTLMKKEFTTRFESMQLYFVMSRLGTASV